ncbi:SusC/RagA family TonB-linked outer membrane protein [uncultured Alistipes sp.]|uniref:SusC/RagA family TonB-linked outer membrane protein n=1 Tax=uncultured Alistipes sp. TaxID=538949 RepID=UPI002805E703|nr:SusC/RagA family TonB-linked outer membrane protein [uncultured Alistipes sp.]
MAPYWTPENLARMEQMGILGDTDWLSKIYKKFGLTHQHNISVSGGTDKVKYYSSVGLMNQDGILRNTDFKRYNMRGNVDAKITRNLTFAINMSVAHTERNWPGLSISPQSEFSPVTQAFYALPLLKETYEGKPLGYTNGSYTYTPLAALEDAGYQNQRTWTFDSTARLEYDFGSIKALQGLKASIFMGYNVGSTLDYNYLRKYSLYKFDPKSFTVTETIAQGIPESNFNKSNSLGWSMTIRPQINYEREFGKHSVSALFFFERRKSYDDTMTGYKTGYYADFPIDLSMGLVNQSPYTTGSHSYTGSAGFAGRISYAYDKKYLLEVTMRADGSYKFAPKNRWGYFPSVAVGWVMSEEAFFKRALPKIEYFKLRASYGVLGSDDTSPYLYMQSFFSTAPGFTCVIGGQPQSAYYTGGYIHDNLTWSRTHTYNFGMELRAFQGKLGIEFDWFYKLTSRILESDSGGTYAPSLGGNNPAWLNSGRVDNRGFELTLRHANSFRNGWSYALTGNLSWARNRVLSRRIADNHPSYRAILGEPLGSIYGFQALGLFQTQEQVDNYPTAPSGWAGLGEIMYKDIDGDGKIDRDHDYVKIGRSTTPEMSFSLNMDVAWKDISLSVLWQGVALCDYQLSGLYGNGHTDNTMYTRPFYGDGNAAYYLVENSWRPDHTNAEYPRLHAITNSNNANASTWWIRNGAYLRLKDVRLSYALPKKLLSKIGIERTSIYVAGTNLLTFSAFKYIDPENPGINNGYYPQQRTYSIGLNLTF